jgi:hypothetical protein
VDGFKLIQSFGAETLENIHFEEQEGDVKIQLKWL